MEFRYYWKKFCPEYNREKARKLWLMSEEAVKVSTDCKKENMYPPASKGFIDMIVTTQTDFFAPYPPQVQATPCPVPCENNGNKTMHVENDKHIESSRINYLFGRVANVESKKGYEFRKTFHLDDDDRPETAEEVIARIQSGKFVLNDETKKKNTYEPQRYITWRDPATPADQDGFKAATKALNVASQEALDAIAVLPPADGLAALKAFESWTYTPAA